MAAYKVRHERGIFKTATDVKNLIDYTTSSTKVQEDGLFGGAVLVENAAEAMNRVTDAYHKKAGWGGRPFGFYLPSDLAAWRNLARDSFNSSRAWATASSVRFIASSQ